MGLLNNPEAIYLGDGDGSMHSVGPDRFRILGGNRHTDDGFALIEYEGTAGAPGPSLQVHHNFDEAWYILDGEVRFKLRDRAITAGRGAYLFIPRGLATASTWSGRRTPAG